MRVSTCTSRDTISPSLPPFPIPRQKHPSPPPPPPPIPNFRSGSSFQRLVLPSNLSKDKPRRLFSSKWSLRHISSIGEGYVASDSPAKALRRILESPGIHQGPACFDALSAKLVERAGFKFCFTSGFSISAARLGLPDVGLISYGEMVDQGLQITQAVSIPVIGDGDNGYGNEMNVKRTVKGFIKAGFAGIILEDQVSPKACGHTRGRRVVPREDAVMRIKAAIDARKESGSDIVIIARSDARQAVSLEEALWRSRAFADAGADVLFIDALASREEMKAFCDISPLLPKMANMLEGGGKTPIMNPIELEEIGFRIVSYPLSLIGVSIRAMEDALSAIKGGRLPPPGSLPSFEEIKETLGFNAYYEEEMRYSTSARQPSYSYQTGYSSTTSQLSNMPSTFQDDPRERSERPRDPIVEVITPYVYDNSSADGTRGPLSGIWSRTLRVKITGRDGLEKLDVRLPIHNKKRNRLEAKKLNDLVFVRYNQRLRDRFENRGKYDPICLDNIDDCDEWIANAAQNDLVFEGEDLTWADVEEAAGLNIDPRPNTRSRSSRGKEPMVEEEELLEEYGANGGDDEEYDDTYDSGDGNGNGNGNENAMEDLVDLDEGEGLF